MTIKLKKLMLPGVTVLFFFVISCATVPVPSPDGPLTAYATDDGNSLPARFAPVFVIENDREKYNRIGTPSARKGPDGEEIIYINPDEATIYARKTRFETAKGTYTNLTYRIHFEKIPGGFFPYHLGKGKNIGLLVVVTLDSQNRPILFTSVHTCGCYLAFVPTSLMPVDVFADGWKKERQSVYSEDLPGVLEYSRPFSGNDRVMILIRSETHRVKDIWLSAGIPSDRYDIVKAKHQPFAALERLPLKNHGTTSFYETSGCRKGYVKESHKTRERLYMSWWAFDWRVGEDKKLGKDENDGILFYTSLKPWRRKVSDLRDFITFSKYWGWHF